MKKRHLRLFETDRLLVVCGSDLPSVEQELVPAGLATVGELLDVRGTGRAMWLWRWRSVRHEVAAAERVLRAGALAAVQQGQPFDRHSRLYWPMGHEDRALLLDVGGAHAS